MAEIPRNKPCICGSGKKYKRCCEKKTICVKRGECVTDKFCILWCCKDFFSKYMSEIKNNIIFECQLGKRYFVKIEVLSEETSKMLSDLLFDETALFTNAKSDTDPITHVGILLPEVEPLCPSKFLAKFVPGMQCVCGGCGVPHLENFGKFLCLQCLCNGCDKSDCAGNVGCNNFIKTIMENIKIHRKSKETGTNFQVIVKHAREILIVKYKEALEKDAQFEIPKFLG